jgi:hypothetical protein
MRGQPFQTGKARVIGSQEAFRPGNMIQARQGSPYGQLFPALQRALQVPLDPNEPADQLVQTVNNAQVTWQSFFINSTTEYIVSAQPNRVVVCVQNQSATNPISVNFDQSAVVNGTSPNFTSQGFLLQPGVTLYIDKWCPTGTVHVSSGNPAQVIQAYSSIGNIPELGVLGAVNALLAYLQSTGQQP